jgi:hypothetical protein
MHVDTKYLKVCMQVLSSTDCSQQVVSMNRKKSDAKQERNLATHNDYTNKSEYNIIIPI